MHIKQKYARNLQRSSEFVKILILLLGIDIRLKLNFNILKNQLSTCHTVSILGVLFELKYLLLSKFLLE